MSTPWSLPTSKVAARRPTDLPVSRDRRESGSSSASWRSALQTCGGSPAPTCCGVTTSRRRSLGPSWSRPRSRRGLACSRWSRQSETRPCQNPRHEPVASRVFLAGGVDRDRGLSPPQQPQPPELAARGYRVAGALDRPGLVAHPPLCSLLIHGAVLPVSNLLGVCVSAGPRRS